MSRPSRPETPAEWAARQNHNFGACRGGLNTSPAFVVPLHALTGHGQPARPAPLREVRRYVVEASGAAAVTFRELDGRCWYEATRTYPSVQARDEAIVRFKGEGLGAVR